MHIPPVKKTWWKRKLCKRRCQEEEKKGEQKWIEHLFSQALYKNKNEIFLPGIRNFFPCDSSTPFFPLEEDERRKKILKESERAKKTREMQPPPPHHHHLFYVEEGEKTTHVLLYLLRFYQVMIALLNVDNVHITFTTHMHTRKYSDMYFHSLVQHFLLAHFFPCTWLHHSWMNRLAITLLYFFTHSCCVRSKVSTLTKQQQHRGKEHFLCFIASWPPQNGRETSELCGFL